MAPRKKVPEGIQEVKPVQDATQEVKAIPDTAQNQKKMPEVTHKKKQLPKVGNPQNTVIIGDQLIEIKPMKLKYQRNHVATFYHILDLYSLTDILSWQAGQLGDDRDGDKALMDWLIAATDNEELITKYYDEMDTGTIEKILQIVKRVNKYSQKEENLKNLARIQKTD